jgi:hypothetical protein
MIMFPFPPDEKGHGEKKPPWPETKKAMDGINPPMASIIQFLRFRSFSALGRPMWRHNNS